MHVGLEDMSHGISNKTHRVWHHFFSFLLTYQIHIPSRFENYGSDRKVGN